MSRTRLAELALLAALVATGCASTSERLSARPSLAPASGAGYREFADAQGKEIELSPLGSAEAALAERPDLTTVLEVVLARSPAIARARKEWAVAIEQVPQATALPDPAVQVLHFVENVETRVGPQENVVTLMQRIPFPTKLLRAGDVAEEGARIAELRYSAAVRDALVAAKTAWYEYAYLARARTLVESNLGIARRLASLGSELYEEDKALFLDVLKAQSQLAQLQYDLVTLEELVSAEKTRLNTLMDRPSEAPVGPPPGLSYARLVLPVEALYEIAVKNREELLIADRMIERARAREGLAESAYGPDFTIGGSYIQIDGNEAPLPVPSDNGKDAWGVSLGVTIPLWVNRISAGVREARAEYEAALDGKVEAWNRTIAAVKDAYFKLTNAERLVLLYTDSLVPQAEQVMLSTEERAREDRMRLGDYLEAQTVWLNFTLAKERALTDYNQSLARLERLTGASLAPATGEEE